MESERHEEDRPSENQEEVSTNVSSVYKTIWISHQELAENYDDVDKLLKVKMEEAEHELRELIRECFGYNCN